MEYFSACKRSADYYPELVSTFYILGRNAEQKETNLHRHQREIRGATSHASKTKLKHGD